METDGVSGDSRLRPRPIPPRSARGGAGEGSSDAPAPFERYPVRSRAIPTRGSGSRRVCVDRLTGGSTATFQHRWHGRGGRQGAGYISGGSPPVWANVLLTILHVESIWASVKKSVKDTVPQKPCSSKTAKAASPTLLDR